MALTAKQQRFVEEYLVDLNATQAAIRAGYSPKTAKQQGQRLLTNVDITTAIEAAKAARSSRTQITADNVLQRFWAIATANPNELIELRRPCCRYCYGAHNRYQRTQGEMDRDRTAYAADKGKVGTVFDELGGVGFDPRKSPHPDCRECFGEGVEQVHPKDTRNLSENAQCLYAGVKVTKDGLEIKMHDQHAALANVARHLGMFEDRHKHEHSGPDGKSIPHEHTVTIADRIEQLAAAFAGATDREETGTVPGNSSGKPVDT